MLKMFWEERLFFMPASQKNMQILQYTLGFNAVTHSHIHQADLLKTVFFY